MQIHHGVAIVDARRAGEGVRRLDVAARAGKAICVAPAVINVGSRGDTGRRNAAADGRQLHERGTEIRVSGRVLLIDVAEILIVSADAHVVREEPVRRCTARFNGCLVIEDRRTDAQHRIAEARKGSGLDHLIDVAGQTLTFGVCRRCAGVDLQFGHAERGQLSGRIVVEGPVYRNAVEFVADLIVVAAANVHGLKVARLIERHDRARNGRDCGIRAVQASAAAERADLVLRGGIDGINVGSRAGFDQTARGSRTNGRNSPQSGMH